MDLYLFKHPDIKELSYFSRDTDVIEKDNFSLLGFKESYPVIESTIIDLSKDSGQNKILNYQTHSKVTLSKFKFDESGEKYINLNGQKLKVVPQGKIPEEVRKRTMLLKHQMINIGSLKKPLKVRVISGATQINSAERLKIVNDKFPLITQDKAINLPSFKKIKLITTKVLKPTCISNGIHSTTSPHHTVSVNPKIVSVKPTQGDDTSTDVSVDPFTIPLNGAVNPREKLLSKQNLKVLNQVKMQALNLSLSKKKQTFGKIIEQLKPKPLISDASVQTDFVFETIKPPKIVSDQTVQTDIQRNCQDNYEDIFDFDLIKFFENGDSPILNNVNIGTGPSIGKLQNTGFSEGGSQMTLGAPIKNIGLSVSGKQLSEDKMRKQAMFFTDLRECLCPNTNGNLPIHEGVVENNSAVVKRMCAALKARRAGVNIENHNGCTPLQLAVINNSQVDIVQTLLDSGADITEVDGEGNNILHLGAKFQRHKILEVILFHQALKDNPSCLNSFNFEGLTPLMICCTTSWTDGAFLFVQHNANVNLRDQTSGRTALFHAAEAVNADIVRLLLEHKADPKIKNFFGTSPHDAMYELEEMPDRIKNLIFGKSKKRTIEAEMNPVRTAKAVKSLKTFSKLQKIERIDGSIMSAPGPPYKIKSLVK